MSIKVNPDFPQSIETIAPTRKKNSDTVTGGKNAATRDQVDLEDAWSANDSPIIQNMQLYVASAHKIASLAEDFHRLLDEENQQDQASVSDLKLATSLTAEDSKVLNDYSDTDLSAQTQNTDSLDSAINSFMARIEGERRAKNKDRLIHAAHERVIKNKEAGDKRDAARSVEKSAAEARLATILDPPKDFVLAAKEKDIADKQALPRNEPDEVDRRVLALTLNPPVDASREYLEAKEKAQLIEGKPTS